MAYKRLENKVYNDDYVSGINYQKLIDTAVGEGNLEQAAQYESQRNAKIAGDGRTQQQTHLYEQYLPDKVTDTTDRPTFNSQYSNTLSNAVNSYLNRNNTFSYDYNTDPSYQAYLKQYTNLGQQARDNTYAQVAARNGGLGSSYATTAAANAYNDYMQKASDMIPQLEQIAYQRWLNERDNEMDVINMLSGLEGTDYSRYSDALGQYNTDRSWNYGVQQDTKADAQSRIQAMLSSGMGVDQIPADLLEASGYGTADLTALRNSYLASKKGTGTLKTDSVAQYAAYVKLLDHLAPLSTEQKKQYVLRNIDSIRASIGDDYYKSLLESGYNGTLANTPTEQQTANYNSTLQHISPLNSEMQNVYLNQNKTALKAQMGGDLYNQLVNSVNGTADLPSKQETVSGALEEINKYAKSEEGGYNAESASAIAARWAHAQGYDEETATAVYNNIMSSIGL